MPVHIDELESSVTPEAEPSPEVSGTSPVWRQVAEMRELHARLVRNRMRTSAEGFDD